MLLILLGISILAITIYSALLWRAGCAKGKSTVEASLPIAKDCR